MKKIMVVAGGEWQVPLIRYIKSMGYHVINTNLYERSPGFVYADESYVVDVLDKPKNLELAQKNKINAVVTDQSDIAVATVAFIAESLGLCGIGTKVATLFTNKYEMRRLCKNLGFPTPQFELCSTSEEAEVFIQKVGKAVFKPQDNQSSRGVHVVNKGQDIKVLFEDTLSACKNGIALIEAFLDGYELTVEGYKTKDKHTTLAISEKRAMPDQPQIASSLWYSISALKKHEKLVKEHNTLIESMGLPFGITHAEYKCNNGHYTLIEVAARGGGTKISSHIISAISGVDVYKQLLGDVLGVDSYSIATPKLKRSVVLDFFRFEPGRIRSIAGVENLLQHPNVIDVALNFREGDKIPVLKDDRSRAGYIIAYAQNDEELAELLPLLKSKVQVNYV